MAENTSPTSSLRILHLVPYFLTPNEVLKLNKLGLRKATNRNSKRNEAEHAKREVPALPSLSDEEEEEDEDEESKTEEIILTAPDAIMRVAGKMTPVSQLGLS